MFKNTHLQTFFKKELAVLGLIIVLAFFLRLYRFNYPLADWHSFRQVDTASVTREYVKHSIDLFQPRYHDLSNIQSGAGPNKGLYKTFLVGLEKYPPLHNLYHQFNGYRISITRPITDQFSKDTTQAAVHDPTADLPDNLEGWRMVEFPFINAMIAVLIRTFPFLPLVQTSRFFSIIFSLGTLISLYYLAKNIWNERVAQLSAVTFAVLPYSVFYSRVVLPEPFMLFFSTTSILFFYLWSKHNNLLYLLFSAASLASALLLKPFVIFLAPVFGIMWLSTLSHRSNVKSKMSNVAILLPFLLMAFLPLLQWRKWIQQFPSGIPASDWLFNSNGILFRPSWFRWLGYERLTKLFLGFFGILFAPFAFIFHKQVANSKEHLADINSSFLKFLILNSATLILLSWWLGILSYFIIIATGNVQHDYYQNLMLPIVCLTVGVGAYNLYQFLKKLEIGNWKLGQYKAFVTVVTLYLLMLFLSWQQVKGFFNVNNWDYIEAGRAVDRLTPADAKVIAPADGDTVFLFQTNRTGWPVGMDIDKKIENGAQYYVTTSYDDEARELEQKYQTVEKTDTYLILNLRTLQ